MAEETAVKKEKSDCGKCIGANGASGGIYGLAFLGAAYYFLQTATSFVDGLIGLVQAIFWPAVLIYKILQLLNL